MAVKRCPRRWIPSVNVSNEWLLGYVPGIQPQNYFDLDHKSAKLIPAGSDIVFEMHYTTNGTPATDQTKVGIRAGEGTAEVSPADGAGGGRRFHHSSRRCRTMRATPWRNSISR